MKTVRFYSDAGLLPPQQSSAGHRRYDATDLARLTLIRSLRSLDVGLGTIGELLAGATDLQHCLHAQERVLRLRLLTVRRLLAVCRATPPALTVTVDNPGCVDSPAVRYANPGLYRQPSAELEQEITQTGLQSRY